MNKRNDLQLKLINFCSIVFAVLDNLCCKTSCEIMMVPEMRSE